MTDWMMLSPFGWDLGVGHEVSDPDFELGVADRSSLLSCSSADLIRPGGSDGHVMQMSGNSASEHFPSYRRNENRPWPTGAGSSHQVEGGGL